MTVRTIAVALAAALAVGWGSARADGPDSREPAPRDPAAARPTGEGEQLSLDLWIPGLPAMTVEAERVRDDGALALEGPRVAVGDQLALRADRGRVSVDDGALEADGSVAGTLAGEVDADAPVEIRADRFQVDVRDGRGVFAGHVVVTHGTLALVCEQLDVRYDPETEAITSVVASGAVEIRQGDRLGRGARAEFDRVAGVVVLTGTPYLEQGGVRLRGTTIRFDVGGGEIDCTGCRAVFGAGR